MAPKGKSAFGDGKDASPGPGAYWPAEAGEAYSDMTRYSGMTIAKGSKKWAKDVGRDSSQPQRTDWMVHTY